MVRSYLFNRRGTAESLSQGETSVGAERAGLMLYPFYLACVVMSNHFAHGWRNSRILIVS
ncbi:hypothetical protein GXM_00189 [Nostoc sphaeroides CCNUC1]|uniref:Uncharacterized protein n=1 Tax=Nostoc sphaeroides CCNUC1 TaxID=2653204 RepID=A0A5P8VR54_9NOSO|nr:hypothetical protein GXM_00189 [Nostoc sphaeroides CCNUC1]